LDIEPAATVRGNLMWLCQISLAGSILLNNPELGYPSLVLSPLLIRWRAQKTVSPAFLKTRAY